MQLLLRVQRNDYFRDNYTIMCNCEKDIMIKKVSIEKATQDNLVKLVKDGIISKDQLVKLIKIK